MKQKAVAFEVPRSFHRWAQGFAGSLGWFVKGEGEISFSAETLRLLAAKTANDKTVDVQLNDHGRERAFIWHPPLTLTVQARFFPFRGQFPGHGRIRILEQASQTEPGASSMVCPGQCGSFLLHHHRR